MLPSRNIVCLNRYKTKIHIYAIYKRLISDLKTHRLKVRSWEKIFYEYGHENRDRIAIFISDKIDFKLKTVIRDKEKYFIMTKG